MVEHGERSVKVYKGLTGCMRLWYVFLQTHTIAGVNKKIKEKTSPKRKEGKRLKEKKLKMFLCQGRNYNDRSKVIFVKDVQNSLNFLLCKSLIEVVNFSNVVLYHHMLLRHF